MAAQSGIAPTQELLSTWADVLNDDHTRVVQIVLSGETLVHKASLDARGSFEDDFELLKEAVESGDDEPCYALYRASLDSNSLWIFFAFVPDNSKIRPKMLYASSQIHLRRAIGDSRFSTNIFATNKDDLTYSAYNSHLSHQSSAAPLTAREQEQAEIRAAEAKEANEVESSNLRGRSILNGANGAGAAVGLKWSKQAQEKIEEMAQGQLQIVQLEIEKEEIILSTPQPTSLGLRNNSPAYTFYQHSLGTIFIYSCPSTSAIKSRLLYSSSSSGVVSFASGLGIKILKKIETSDPSEIDETYIDSEIGPIAQEGSTTTSLPPAAAEKPAFARPTRPGRKR